MKKKSLFLAALAALTMATSCSQDEQQSVNKGHAISFNAALDVTRGDDVTTKTLNDFWVNAASEEDVNVVLFNNNLQFTKKSDGNSTKWVSASPKYWPNYKVKFYAYAPEAGEKNGFTVSMNKINDFTVKEKAGDQIDLIAGSVSGSKQDNEKSGVTLQLSHALSKIVFKAKGKHDQFKCEIYGIGIGNVYNKGNYDIGKNEWSIIQTNNVNYYHKFEKPIVIDKTDGVETLTPPGGFKLIPQTITPWNQKEKQISKDLDQVFICMFIVLKDKADNNKTTFRGFAYLPMPNTSWGANMEYVYTIDLSKGWGFRGGIKQPDNPDDTSGPDAPNPDKPVPDNEGTEKPDVPVQVTSDPIVFVGVSVSEWSKQDEKVTGEVKLDTANK